MNINGFYNTYIAVDVSAILFESIVFIDTGGCWDLNVNVFSS